LENQANPKMSFSSNVSPPAVQDPAKVSWEDIKLSFRELAPSQQSRPLSDVKLPELRLEPFEIGKSGARDWLTRFSLYIQTKGLAEDTKPAVLGLFLKGGAWHWYLTLDPQIRSSWERLAEEFLRHFDNQKFRFVRLNDLMSKEQKVDQSVEKYSAEILELAMALSISESERLSFFIRGLQPQIRSFVLRSAPATYADAVTQAKLYEATAPLNSAAPTATAIVAAIQQLGFRPQSTEEDIPKQDKLEALIQGLTKDMRSMKNQLELVNTKVGYSPNFRSAQCAHSSMIFPHVALCVIRRRISLGSAQRGNRIGLGSKGCPHVSPNRAGP
jgi:hypothetical protein